MDENLKKIYEFGSFRLDVTEQILSCEGAPVALTPKVFDLLVLLIENHGHLMEKKVLLEKLWQDSFVEEANLNVNISALRRALGEKPNEHKFIETVPRRGYRFVAEVREIKTNSGNVAVSQIKRCPKCQSLYTDESLKFCRKDGEPLEIDAQLLNRTTTLLPKQNDIAAQSSLTKSKIKNLRLWLMLSGFLIATISVIVLWKLAFTSAKTEVSNIHTVAVLPFKPLVNNQSDGALEMGMADALITKLSNLQQITVRPTSSVTKYSDANTDPIAAGRELQVEAVLEGKVQRADNKIRVTIQLLRVSDGATLWADSFDDFFTNIFTVQDSISEKMTSSLALRLSGKEQQQLVKRHTENTEAYRLYLEGRYHWEKRMIEGLRRAIDYFNQAIALDPNYSQAYAGLADCFSLLSNYDTVSPQEPMKKAKEMSLKALQLDETLAEAHTSLGLVKKDYDWDFVGAEKEFKRAIELNPNYATAWHWYAETLVVMGRFEEALNAVKRAHELDPLSLSIISKKGWVLYHLGRYDEAIAECRKALEMDTNFWIAHLYLGMVYERQAKYKEALVELNKARELYDGNVEAIALIGYINAVSGKKVEGQKFLNELRVLSKQKYVTPFAPALIYIGLGEKEQAIELLKKAYTERDTIEVYFLRCPQLDSLRSEPRFISLMESIGLQ